MSKKRKGPKVLLLDIETSPIEAYVWGLFDQNIGLNQVIEDWSILSYSAKWLGENKMFYDDTRKKSNPRDDKQLVKNLHKLMSEADILVYQNGDKFDLKKIKARVEFHKFKRLPKYQTFDTYKVAKKNFGLTSYKLEYMCEFFGLPHKKLKTKKFVGMDLWRACLNHNKEAWNEMEAYNRRDVEALEDLYNILSPYGTINFNIYTDEVRPTCNCGSNRLHKRGYRITTSGKFIRYQCQDCGAWMSEQGKENNLMSLDKKKSLLKRE